jgi:demethylmenaquinone methyltransferase/2-methoxy-6-polyprenyl-1,4-benzoquinol methylase
MPVLSEHLQGLSDRVIPPMGRLVTGDAQPYQYSGGGIRKFPGRNSSRR